MQQTQTEPQIGAQPRRGRDRFLDTIKAVAVVRVVLWHTWSWWWLSWIPAMPAMFFASGALLEDSLQRRGWWATMQQRFRRLIVPFWAYSAASVAVMVLSGWRPSPGELLGWVVPLVDPVGDAALPGLWIPLWYVRAYLWFVIGSEVLSRAVRRVGVYALLSASLATVLVWWWMRSGHDVPAEVGDAVAYSVFVMAGMLYRREGTPRAVRAWVCGVAALVSAVAWWAGFGPADGVVNRSYVLTMLVGIAGLAIAIALREPLASLHGRPAAIVEVIGRRALTIYLWQGFGLVAAQRLVDSRMEPGPLRAVGSITIVALVIVAAVALVGPLEDQAARRAPTGHRRRLPTLASCVPGVALVVLAFALPAVNEPVEAPLSGKAVVTRAEVIQRSLEGSTAEVDQPAEELTGQELTGQEAPGPLSTTDALRTALEGWISDNQAVVERVDLNRLDVAVLTAGGERYLLRWERGAPVEVAQPPDGEGGEVMPWWSVTKAATAAWLMRSVESGQVRLDDTLGRWVPEAPNATSITLEQLARHTSGIPTALDRSFLESAPDLALADYAANPELSFEPGTGFEYSRTGYFLLALALERATGTTWRAAMEDLAVRAGVELTFDEDLTPLDRVTDPDGRGYRGGLWSSGGILASLEDSAALFNWIFTEGLAEPTLATMTRFASDPQRWFYGIGLMPLCPCETVGDTLGAQRYGLDSPTAFMVHDARSSATVMAAADSWFDDDGPAVEFYDLQGALLDAAGR
ncbi:MAG: serine hydrolase [Microthrixaceae bacterium]